MNRDSYSFDETVVAVLSCGGRCCLVPSDANPEKILSA